MPLTSFIFGSKHGKLSFQIHKSSKKKNEEKERALTEEIDLVAIQQHVEIFCSETVLHLLWRWQTKPYGVSFQAFKENYILSKPANCFKRFLVGTCTQLVLRGGEETDLISLNE